MWMKSAIGFYDTMALVFSSLVTMEAFRPFLLEPVPHVRRAAHRLLAKPRPLDNTVLKDTVVGASCRHTPEPKQFAGEFSGRPLRRLNTQKQPFKICI